MVRFVAIAISAISLLSFAHSATIDARQEQASCFVCPSEDTSGRKLSDHIAGSDVCGRSRGLGRSEEFRRRRKGYGIGIRPGGTKLSLCCAYGDTQSEITCIYGSGVGPSPLCVAEPPFTLPPRNSKPTTWVVPLRRVRKNALTAPQGTRNSKPRSHTGVL